MDKIKEKAVALMIAIDDVYFDAFMNMREHPELKSTVLTLVRVLGNVQEYLENFIKFCENGEQFDNLLFKTEHGQEDAKCSGQAE